MHTAPLSLVMVPKDKIEKTGIIEYGSRKMGSFSCLHEYLINNNNRPQNTTEFIQVTINLKENMN